MDNTAVLSWVDAIVGHAARTGVTGINSSLACVRDKSVDFWRALENLGLYAWYEEQDLDSQRRHKNIALLDLLIESQKDVMHDIVRAARETRSEGGLWLKAIAARRHRAGLYPQERYRICTDVDVWFAEPEVERMAEHLLRNAGYVPVTQAVPWPRNYELGLVSPEGVLVELHAALGPYKGWRSWFGRLNGYLQKERQYASVQPLSLELQLVHAVIHFFQHAGHIKYYQLLELLLLLRIDTVRDAARAILWREGYDQLWAWVVVRVNRLWPPEADADTPAFLRKEKTALPVWQRGLWSNVLDSDGMWRGPQPYRGPKALALLLGL